MFSFKALCPHVSTKVPLMLCLMMSILFGVGSIILTWQGVGNTLLSCGAVGNASSHEVSRQCDGKHVFVDILDDGTLILDHVNASLLEPHLGRRYFLPTSATVIGSLCVGVVVASMPLLLWRSFQGGATRWFLLGKSGLSVDTKEGVDHLNALADFIRARWGNNGAMLATLMLSEAVGVIGLLGMVGLLDIIYQYTLLPAIFGTITSMEGDSLRRAFPHTATCEFVRHGVAGIKETYYVDCQLGGSKTQQIIIPLISLLAVAVTLSTFIVLLFRTAAVCCRRVRLFILTVNNPHLDAQEVDNIMAAGCGGAVYADLLMLCLMKDILDMRAYSTLLKVLLGAEDANLIFGEAPNNAPPALPIQEQPQPLAQPEEVEMAERAQQAEPKQPPSKEVEAKEPPSKEVEPKQPPSMEVEPADGAKQAGAEDMV